MKKSLIVMIAVLLVSALMISCNSDVSEASAGSNSLAKVSVMSTSAKALQTIVSGSTEVEDLYWYYTATKTDGSLFTTGQTTEKKLIDTFNPAGEPAKTHGLLNADLGLFSTGNWSFSFYGYKTAKDGNTSWTDFEELNKPVYYQENLAATVTTTTNLTVTLTEGEGMGDATIKFSYGSGTSIQYPNWTYNLAPNKELTLYVYSSNPSVSPAPAAVASSTKATNSSGYVDFTDLADIKLSSGTQTLYFRVMYGTEVVGSFDLGLNVKKGTTISVYGSIENLDSTYHVYVRTVNKTTVEATIISENVGKTITEGSDSTSAAESGTTAVVTTKSPQNAASSTVTADTALETGTKVTLPSAVLETNSSTKEGTTTTDKTVSHDLTVDVKSENLAETAFEIKAEDEGSTPVAGIDLTLVKTTTTTVTVKDSTEEDASIISKSTDIATAVVDTFKSGSDPVYVTIDTYIAKGLADVKVRYNGTLEDGAAAHVFNEYYATAMAGTLGVTDTTSSNSGTGYDPATGRLVFKTPHFSSFYVISKPVAAVYDDTTLVKSYGSLEEAFSAVNPGQIVKLLDNVTTGSGYSITNPLVFATDYVTFDLSGLTLTISNNFSFVIQGDNSKVKNGTVASATNTFKKTGYNSYVVVFNDCKGSSLENLTITGGVSVGGSQSDWGTTSNPKSGISYQHGAAGASNITIKNCNITSGDYYAVASQMGSTATIDGGRYTSNQTAVYSNVGQLSPAVLHGRFVGDDGPEGNISVLSGEFVGSIKSDNIQDGYKWVELSGGYYSFDSTSFCADGFRVVENSDVEGCSYRVISYVAKIDNTYYSSLAEAVEAVPTDGTETTITMISDESVVAGVTVAAGKKIVLELNGYTVSGNTDSTTTYALLTNRGTLTIQDSTDIKKDGTGTGLLTTYIINADQQDIPGYASNTVTNNGTLTVKSGKIVNNGNGYACYAIDNQTNGTSYNPVLNIEGGRFEQMNAYTYAIRMFCNSTTNTNTVNVTGGVITGGYGLWLQTPNANSNNANLTISGGTINARDGAALYIGGTKADNSKISISITGGKISGTGVIIQGPLSGTYGSISITDGTFENVQCGANVEKFITGGEYIERPDEDYIAEGYLIQGSASPWHVVAEGTTQVGI